jgi:hypothetical protein
MGWLRCRPMRAPQEHLEWVAQDVVEACGTSSLWRARLTSRSQERDLVATMRASRAAEYDALIGRLAAARAVADQTSLRSLRSLRRELREIQRRDYFPPLERDRARTELKAFADALATEQQAVEP